MDEREPVFTIIFSTKLDGQEYPPTASEYVENRIKATLSAMVHDGTITSYTIVKTP